MKLCIALANHMDEIALDNGEIEIAIPNSDPLSDDGWALIAPYGEHPKSRIVTKPGGGIALENFVQVVDHTAVDQILAEQNKLLPRLKRALVGISVYKLHPDLKDAAPETVDSGSRSKDAIGVIDKFRKSDRGLEAHFTLTQEGAKAVANDGYKYPSIFWWVLPIGKQGDTVRVRPIAFISAGLTPVPNIKGVDSLANSLSAGAGASGGNQNKNTMKNTLIGFLAAKGISLANDSGDQAVLAAVNQILTSAAGEVTTLRTEIQTLTGKLTALDNTKTDLTTQLNQAKTDLGTAQTALSNSQSAFKAERKARAEAIADLAIQQGRRPVSDRENIVTALSNSATFDEDAKALLSEAVKYKVTGTSLANSGTGKSAANAEDPRATVQRLTQKKMDEMGCSGDAGKYGQCQAAVLRENPTLADALKNRAPQA